MPDHLKCPTLSLPVLRWEYKELYEKDENYDIVYEYGLPKVGDSWVIVYLLAVDGKVINVEIDREPFDKYIFPLLFYPSLTFWKSLAPAHHLYGYRKAVLEDLMELKTKLNL